MINIGPRRLLSGTAVVALAVTAGLISSATARADTITASTTCTNAFTGANAGPSTFDVEIPATAVVGDPVAVTVVPAAPRLHPRRTGSVSARRRRLRGAKRC